MTRRKPTEVRGAWLVFPLALAILAGCGARSGLDDALRERPDGPTTPGSDAGSAHDATVVTDAAAADALSIPLGVDAAALLPCLEGTGNLLHAEGIGYPGIEGVLRMTDADGAWNNRDFGDGTLIIEIGDHDRPVAIIEPVALERGLRSGETYASGMFQGTEQYLQLVLRLASCATLPTGSFTFVKYRSNGGDQGMALEVLMFFDLRCNYAEAGAATGCVRYAR